MSIMAQFDWRSPKAYSQLETAELPGLAWEYLRRNPVYREEYWALVDANGETPAEFRKKWGLTFRR